jgi:hypothetical protein
MDEITREIVTAAIRAADQAAADHAQWEAAREQRRAVTNNLVVKDFPTEYQLPPYEPPASDHFNKKVWTKAIGIALSETRAEIRKQIDAASERLAERIDKLAARVDALEGDVTRIAYLDENLRKTDMENSKFVKVEFKDGIELLKIERNGNGYSG